MKKLVKEARLFVLDLFRWIRHIPDEVRLSCMQRCHEIGELFFVEGWHRFTTALTLFATSISSCISRLSGVVLENLNTNTEIQTVISVIMIIKIIYLKCIKYISTSKKIKLENKKPRVIILMVLSLHKKHALQYRILH